ncbi:MAG: DUF2125 domain-containing protein, partial [Gammaproteobacteria bacterium]
MSMIARRVFVLPLVLMAALAAIYAVLWFVVATWVEDGFRNWSRVQTERGNAVEYGTLAVSGFPGPIRLTIPSPEVTSRKGGWQWAADAAVLETRPWDWRRFRVEIEGKQRAAVPFAGVLRRYSAAPDETLVVGEVDEHGRVSRSLLTVRGLRLDDAAGVEVLGAKTLSVHMNLREPAGAQGQGALDLTVQANAVHLGAPIDTPLDRDIQDIALVTTVRGALPDTILRDAIEAWRRSGGTLEMSHFQIDWGRLSLRANGTLSVDEGMRPLGALTADIKGYAETLSALERARILKRQAAAGTQLALDLLSRRGDGDGRRIVTVPVAAQNGALYLGPV